MSGLFLYGFIFAGTTAALGFLLSSCGGEETIVVKKKEEGESPRPTPAPLPEPGESPTPQPPPPGPTKASWDDIKPDVLANCVNCHNGTKHPLDLSTKANWDRSNSQRRIANDSMPPNKRLESNVKTKLLSYF